ncbi:MAG: hypothetical protein IJH52_00550 [Oscillospiraceae bacterium]|nr:hypothetical protein [Oscillospiraceae bacterium]
MRYTRSSSEWACSAPPPDIGFAAIRRLRIRAPILPLQNEPALLGFVLVVWKAKMILPQLFGNFNAFSIDVFAEL